MKWWRPTQYWRRYEAVEDNKEKIIVVTLPEEEVWGWTELILEQNPEIKSSRDQKWHSDSSTLRSPVQTRCRSLTKWSLPTHGWSMSWWSHGQESTPLKPLPQMAPLLNVSLKKPRTGMSAETEQYFHHKMWCLKKQVHRIYGKLG